MREFVYTPAHMHACDTATLKRENISNTALMKRAAYALFTDAVKLGILSNVRRIVVVGGPGHNGGDALMMAHYLKRAGYAISAYHITSSPNMPQSLTDARNLLETQGIPIEDETTLPSALRHAELVIDGLFGIGLSRAPSAPFDGIIETINASGCPVVSLDIPSGLNAYNGEAYDPCVHASYTLIVQTYKSGNLLRDALDVSGTMHLVDAGIDHISSVPLMRRAGGLPHLYKRSYNTHKYDYGSVLVIGGSEGMEGAALLSAQAALKSGAGVCSVAYGPSANAAMYHDPTIMARVMNFDNIDAHLEKKDVVIFGVGLGRDADYTSLLQRLIECAIPLIIDADGLYHFAKIHQRYTDLSNVIITPHAGEMAMLLSTTVQNVLDDPLRSIEPFTKRNMHVVLKGPTSLLASRETVVFSTAHNPGLAKAGMGDVLSGIIAAQIKRTPTVLEALENAHIIQRIAGASARDIQGVESILPTDLIKCLPDALKMLQ